MLKLTKIGMKNKISECCGYKREGFRTDSIWVVIFETVCIKKKADLMELRFRWMIFLGVLVVQSFADDVYKKHITTFIKAVETIEADNPGLEPLAVLRGLRKAANIDSAFIQNSLGSLYDAPELVLNPRVTGFITSVLKYRVVRNVEHGVVFTNEGHTVALTPLLLGVEAGLTKIDALYPLSITKNLALSFLQHSKSKSSTPRLGPRGLWDDVSNPQVFTLPGTASLATDALIHGGIDGVILGKHVAEPSNRPLKLSSLLNQYYNHQLDSTGLDGAPALISQRRRSIFKNLITLPLLTEQARKSLKLTGWKNVDEKMEVIYEGLKEFYQAYAACPPFVSRAEWGAAPYIGSPSYLNTPLTYMFIHHTEQPSRPCTTFEQCAADMRSMQNYHQNTNGWDDIGYSFVVGGEGNIYIGRGWDWVGAHTQGYNSVGYGVSYIGDFTSSLPSQSTLDLVRLNFADCATNGGYLISNYIIHGHRQMVSTSCPGDRLYSEIRTWPHFQER